MTPHHPPHVDAFRLAEDLAALERVRLDTGVRRA